METIKLIYLLLAFSLLILFVVACFDLVKRLAIHAFNTADLPPPARNTKAKVIQLYPDPPKRD